ncbi:MAG: hypothetical protein WAU33_10440, partial [Candidatus Binataceae bacterium]
NDLCDAFHRASFHFRFHGRMRTARGLRKKSARPREQGSPAAPFFRSRKTLGRQALQAIQRGRRFPNDR